MISFKAPLDYFERRFGAEELNRFLASTGMPREYFEEHNNWISFEYGQLILRELVRLAGDDDVCLAAGKNLYRPEVIGRAVWVGVKALGTPSLVYQKMFALSSIYNRVGDYTVRALSKNRMVVEYRPKEGYYEKDKCYCLFRQGNFIAAPSMCNLPPARLVELSCNVEGAETCTYELSWQEKTSSLPTLLGVACGGLAALLLTRLFHIRHEPVLWLVGGLFPLTGFLGGRALALLRALRLNRRVNEEQHEALEKSIKDISNKYLELQASQKELGLAHEELKEHRDHLEELVQERTRELEESKKRLEESYEKLQELDRMKMRFFTNISHELRTPLTLTLSPVEAMLQGETGPVGEHQRAYLVNVHTNALRLLKLINNLLDLAKLEAGKMSLQYGQYDLGEFIEEIVASFQPAGEKKQIEIRVQGGPPLPNLCFDREKVEKVVINLIGNALKFTPAGGSIAVQWVKGPDLVSISVLDSGPGIPDSHLGRIFDRFVQVDDSLSRKHGGTGIGLALAKEITELHGGTISAANRPEGGAAFSFTLPLEAKEIAGELEPEKDAAGWVKSMHRKADYVEEVERAASSALPAPSAEEDAAPSAPAEPVLSEEAAQVLVVEDNSDMRRFIADCLAKEFSVRTAVDGDDGWNKVLERQPDLVVSDIMMPNRNGYELCQLIKSDARVQHVPLILLSSKSEVDMKIEGFARGADDYLTKPFNPRELVARVKNMIKIRSLEKEIHQHNVELQAALQELKETQAQLVHSEKMASLGILSAGLVHEINNPLNAAVSSLNTLVRTMSAGNGGDRPGGLASQEKAERAARRALLGLKRCEEIVNGLRRFARKDVDGMKEDDIHEGLESTLALLVQDPGRKVSVHRDYRLTGRVPCNLGQLNQVFMNLLTNAVQAIENKGDIWVRTEQRGDEAVISVQDSGVGIPPEKLPRIFEPFFTTKEVGQGTGLGLSISHKIVQQHNGRIEVESAPGKGSTFRVFLPMHFQGELSTKGSTHGKLRSVIGM
ncbi:MAG: ATP-binding protein [bacterium]